MATRVLDLRGLVVKVVSSEGTLQLEGDADLEIFLSDLPDKDGRIRLSALNISAAVVNGSFWRQRESERALFLS